MSGHMGAETVTQRGLVVVDRDPARNLLLVSGSVPGADRRPRLRAGGPLMAAPGTQRRRQGQDRPLTRRVFGLEPKPVRCCTRSCKAEQAARRQGTHATKTRGQVAGGRAKPYRQKGTGRARQGTTRAAQFAGGGVVFGPQPRSYSVKVNRKAYLQGARDGAVAARRSEGSLGVFDAARSTRRRRRTPSRCWPSGARTRPLVVVIDDTEDAAAYSFRNLPKTVVLTVDEIEVEALLWARSLLVSATALSDSTGCSATARPLAVAAASPQSRSPPRPRRMRHELDHEERPATSSWRRSWTEKSARADRGRTATPSSVASAAHKTQVKQAVEEICGVRVTTVRIINARPKRARRARVQGTRPGYKKAIVSLAPGDKITLFEGMS